MLRGVFFTPARLPSDHYMGCGGDAGVRSIVAVHGLGGDGARDSDTRLFIHPCEIQSCHPALRPCHDPMVVPNSIFVKKTWKP
jgi:hypothetical protein